MFKSRFEPLTCRNDFLLRNEDLEGTNSEFKSEIRLKNFSGLSRTAVATECPCESLDYTLTVCVAVYLEVLRPVQLYCIVVGSRRLMPPDALQPKVYCTNPGL